MSWNDGYLEQLREGGEGRCHGQHVGFGDNVMLIHNTNTSVLIDVILLTWENYDNDAVGISIVTMTPDTQNL